MENGESSAHPEVLKTREEQIDEILLVMQRIDDAHEPGSSMSLEEELAKLNEYDPELVRACATLRRQKMYELPRPQWIGGRVA
jgi:hypothetical protein